MENQKRTLEQAILEAGRAFWADNGNNGLGMSEGEMRRIAAAVREWMREQNEELRGVIFDILLEELPPQSVSHADADSCVDAILSVIPPEVMRTRTFKEAEEHMAYICKIEEENVNLRKRLPDPATLQTEMEKWQASRIRELEYELDLEVWQHAACLTIAETGEKWGLGVQPSAAMQAVYKLHNELAEEKSTRNLLTDENNALRVRLEEANATCSVSPNDLAAVRKELEEERVQVDWLKGEIVALQVRLKDERKLAEKAKQYDKLREKFPFLPGEEFWTLFQNSVTRWTIEKVWFNNDGRLCLNGYRERQNGSILESPTYKASECYPTAEACRNAIKVEQ